MSRMPPDPQLRGSASLGSVFEQAKKEFLASLTTEDQLGFSSCSSAQALLQHVKEFEVVAKSKQRGLRLAQKIQSLSDNLEPYFKVIELICGAQPEVANLVWGALRLILQLASNFSTFFDKLCETIRKLSLAVPQYEDLFMSLESGPPVSVSQRLRDSMLMFYADLFSFFQAVAGVFSDKRGKLKRTPFVIGDLLWKPFDVRFQSILESLQFHQSVLKEELHWAKMGSLESTMRVAAQRDEATREALRSTHTMALKLSEKFSQKQRNSFVTSVVEWLDPEQYAIPFEAALDAREDGTAEWLFDETKFEIWRDNPHGSLLWIQGNPGWGKTVLAAASTKELCDLHLSDSDTLPIVCYYFFAEGTKHKASRLGAYRAIATQLFQQCHQLEGIYNIFSIAKEEVCVIASEHEVLELLQLALSKLSNVFFVLDGIDECMDNAKLLRELREFTTSSNLKTILFSRPNVACLRRFVTEDRKICMSRPVLDRDITLFLDNELLILRDASLLPDNLDIPSSRDMILQRSDGMFLWARLMIYYLASPALTRAERIEEISNCTPEGLDDMYFKIFNHIQSMDRASRQLASQIFMWVGYGKSYMTPSQIKEAIWGSPESAKADQLDDIEHGIIVSCCGLIEKRQDKYLQFIHLTAREFILSPRLCSKTGLSFVLPESEAASKMARRCLEYVTTSIPSGPLGGDTDRSTSRDQLKSWYPFLEYAAIHWAEHVQNAVQDCNTGSPPRETEVIALTDTLEEFLMLKPSMMVWIEALYTYGAFSSTKILNSLAENMAILLSRSQNSLPANFLNVAKDIADLAIDLKELNSTWVSTLSSDPYSIWNDVTAFTPSRFFLRSSAVTVDCMPPQPPAEITHRDRPIFAMSSNSPDGRLVANLSVWPSRAFTEFWEAPAPFEEYADNYQKSESQPENILNELEKTTMGWNAKYELFTLEANQKAVPRGSAEFPLQDTEVLLLLRQSLRISPLKSWKMSFPLAISRDLGTVIVLRTVFIFDMKLAGDDLPLKYSSATFPLHSPRWSHDLPFFQYTFSYEWLLSHDNRYVLYHSYDRAPGSHDQQEPLISFRINHDENLNLDQISTIKIHRNGLDGRNFTEFFWALHPHRPEFIFSLCGAIWLADFEGDSTAILLRDLMQDEFPIDTYSSTSFNGAQNIDKIGFSACGKYFIITYIGVQWPQIYPFCASGSAVAIDHQVSPTNQHSNSIIRKRKAGDSTEDSIYSTMQMSKIPKVIHSESIVLSARAGSNTPGTIQLSHGTMRHSLQLVAHGQDSNVRTVSLAKLPDTIDLNHTNTTLILPSDSNGPLRVILNAAPKPSYDSDESHTSPYLPVALDRNPRSLALRQDITRDVLDGGEGGDERFSWSRQALHNAPPSASSIQAASQDSSGDFQNHYITNYCSE